MRAFVKTTVTILAVFGGISLVLLLFVVNIAVKITRSSVFERPKEVPKKMVLYIDFSRVREDWISGNRFSRSLEKQLSVVDVVRTLKKAKTDSSVTALFADISHVGLSYAQVEEIRDAVTSFAKSGKPTVAWADTFNEGAGGMRALYLSTAFSKAYLQDAGMAAAGIHAENIFLRSAFDKLKIKPIGAHRKEYKSYWNMFAERGYTRPHREATKHLLSRIFETVSENSARSRSVSADVIRRLADTGPWNAQQLAKEKLITGTAYREDAINEAKKTGGTLYSSFYYFRKSFLVDDVTHSVPPNSVAVIYVGGAIHRGASSRSFDGSTSSSGARTVAAALKKAKSNPNVKAIILRVNSPGGSVVASETMWHETVSSPKPIVVSMSSVAASGGYYISMNADRIFVEPSTITGSIGVVIGKFYTKEFWHSLGIDYDFIAIGNNEMMYSSLTTLSVDQLVLLNKHLDQTYDTFVSRVAKGRHLSADFVESVAKGRVWAGTDAVSSGLADEFGGIMKALQYIAKKINVSEEKLSLIEFPKTKSLLSLLFNGDDDAAVTLTPLSSFVAPEWQPLFSAVFPGLFPADTAGIRSEMELRLR